MDLEGLFYPASWVGDLLSDGTITTFFPQLQV
jgi:hypothetical protein